MFYIYKYVGTVGTRYIRIRMFNNTLCAASPF